MHLALNVNINRIIIMASFVTVWSRALEGNSALLPSDVKNVARFCSWTFVGKYLFVRCHVTMNQPMNTHCSLVDKNSSYMIKQLFHGTGDNRRYRTER